MFSILFCLKLNSQKVDFILEDTQHIDVLNFSVRLQFFADYLALTKYVVSQVATTIDSVGGLGLRSKVLEFFQTLPCVQSKFLERISNLSRVRKSQRRDFLFEFKVNSEL